MKVLIDARRIELHETGIGRYIAELTRAIANGAGIVEPVLGVRSLSQIPAIAKELRLPTFELGHEQGVWPSATNFDLVHLTFPLARPPRRMPFVVTVYDLIYWDSRYTSVGKSALFRKLLKRSVNAAAGVLAISEFTAADTLSVMRPAVVQTTPLGVNLPEPQAGNPRAGCLYVGNLKRHKGVMSLLPALAANPSIILRVITHDDASELIAQAARHGVGAAQISIQSEVSDQGLVDAYSNAEFVLCPSEYEGFGLPALEGVAYGCSVLASDIPAYQEMARKIPMQLVKNGWSAALFGLESAAPVTLEARMKMAKAARNAFLWSTTARLTETFYAEHVLNA